jgi:hypothetical protein
MGWSSEVFCTHNFLQTVLQESGGQPASLAEYLRPVTSFLCLQYDVGMLGVAYSVLLVSEREADAIKRLLAKQQGTWSLRKVTWSLLNLTHVRIAKATPELASRLCLTHREANIVARNIVSLQLLEGETKYASEEQRQALMEHVDSAEAKRGALLLPVLRGKGVMVYRSDLERACG